MITLITGVPGTGKTALIVSWLEDEIKKGRIVFSNITGLKLPHYRLGKMSDWQKGTWLHIDQYVRTGSEFECGEEESDGSENWMPHPDVITLADTGELRRAIRNEFGEIVNTVPYESHKGALIVFDEAQNGFRPRPSGSVVPDCVAALEVHRKQGLDFWILTQRPMQVDAALRGLTGRHIALRSTALGRFKYEWPEVGDIESKFSRDTAARSRYKLPSHVFHLYKSAEVHTVQKHSMPFMVKALFLLVPLFGALLFSSYKAIASKFDPKPAPVVANESKGAIKPANYVQPVPQSVPPGALVVPQEFGLVAYDAKSIENRHPFDRHQFAIVGRLTSTSKDLFRFSAMENGQHAFYISSADLEKAGYSIVPINDCSVKLIYKAHEFFVTCNAQPVQQIGFQPAPVMQPQQQPQQSPAPIILQPYP